MNKKQMALILAAAMTAQTVPMFGGAAAAPAEVILKGRYETNVPIKVEYSANGEAAIQWEVSDNGVDGWTAVEGAASESFTPGKDLSKKWIRAAVTADGGTAYSKPKQMKERWYGKAQTGCPAESMYIAETINSGENVPISYVDASGARESSNPNVLFTVDENEYLLLDTTEDDNSHFLVMKRTAIGEHKASTGSQFMDELMCWLNDKESVDMCFDNNLFATRSGAQDYSQSGGYRADMKSAEPVYTVISEKLIRHIDENAVWKQEPKMYQSGDCEITYSGGITIPSLTDYERYKDKIGWRDFSGDPGSFNYTFINYMCFRTGHANPGAGDDTTAYDKGWGLGTIYPNPGAWTGYADIPNGFSIRPMFFLNKDVFLDKKIAAQMDFTKIGEDVKVAIANSASKAELIEAGYKASDIEPYIVTTGELSDISADGIYDTSLPITISYTYDGDEKFLKFNVLASDSADGEFSLIKTQTGDNKVVIPTSAGGKYVKIQVETPDGIIKETDVHLVGAMWDRDTGIHNEMIEQEVTFTDNTTGIVKALDTVRETTPPEYVFSVGGMDFIMLDTTESDASKFFVMSKNIVDGEPVQFDDGGQLMDGMMDFLNSTNGVQGYMPNGDYIGRTDTDGENIDVIMPDDILNHINYNKVWKVERKMWNDTEERTVIGGISFPAMHEIRQYSEKIGLWDDKVDWWTRTPYGVNGNGDTMIFASPEHLGAFFSVIRQSSAMHIRPVFYLDKSMFTDKVYDLSGFGADVLAQLRKAYTREELANAGYSEEALKNYYDVDGELTAVKIKGIFETSLPVKADFTYSGSNLNNIKITWKQADTADGEYKTIGSVSGKDNNFRLPYSAGGKYVKAEVLCVPTGTSVETEARFVEDTWGPQAAINPDNQPGEDGYITGGQDEKYKYNPINERMPKTTPAKYTFTYGGKEYILLDKTESDESHYLVLAKDVAAQRAFKKVSDGGQTFEDLIGWLNDLDVVSEYVEGTETTVTTGYKGTGFLSSADALPKALVNHINMKNNWKVERKMWLEQYERVYEGGIAIPAYKELERYAEKIGSYDAGAKNVWLRTPNAQKGGSGETVLASGTAEETAGFTYAMLTSSENWIRPIFYLDKDFFTSVRVENIGEETAAIIRNDVLREDMSRSGLYSEAELDDIYREPTPIEQDYVKAEYTNLKEGGSVIAHITTNIPGDGVEWTFIAAVYDESGKLLGVNTAIEESVLDENDIYTTEITVGGIKPGSGNYAKVFVWDGGLEDMYPLYKAN